MKALTRAALVLAIGAAMPATVAGLVIGGFDVTRGGIGSIEDSGLAGARAAILSAFPGTTFSTANTLTAGFLSGVNVVILGSAAGNSTAITPLSLAEQIALVNFVESGGGVILLADNDSFDGGADLANQSLVSPFGHHATGTLIGGQGVSMLTPGADPISGGPFGTVTGATFLWPGWFDVVPAGAVGVGTLTANSQTALTYLQKGVLAPGSGGAVLFGDVGFIVDGYADANSYTLLKNSVAYLVPEPGPIALGAGLGLAAFAVGRRIVRQ